MSFISSTIISLTRATMIMDTSARMEKADFVIIESYLTLTGNRNCSTHIY